MKAMVFASLAGLFWGVGEVFTKSVLHSGKIGPVTALAVRSTVALPVMLLTWWIVMRRQLEPVGWSNADGPTLAKLVVGSGLIAGAGHRSPGGLAGAGRSDERAKSCWRGLGAGRGNCFDRRLAQPSM